MAHSTYQSSYDLLYEHTQISFAEDLYSNDATTCTRILRDNEKSKSPVSCTQYVSHLPLVDVNVLLWQVCQTK